MADIVHALKTRARILQKQISGSDAAALKKARKLPELNRLDDPAIATTIKRRHCLALVARECGFDGWSHLVAFTVHNDRSKGLGTLLNPDRCFAHWNIWFADYDEARQVRAEHGGYLLGYKKQYLVVDEDYIQTLGFDPKEDDVEATGKDWVNPKDIKARSRLLFKLVQMVHSNSPLYQPDKTAA